MSLFERAEYEARVAKTKAAMAQAGIDVLLVTEPANIYYLTGHAMTAYYFRQFVIVALDDIEPLWVGREWTDGVSAKNTVFMDESRVLGHPECYVRDPDREPTEFLTDVLTTRGWDRSSIGMELQERSVPYATAANLMRRLPNARFQDATGLVNRLRVAKSDREVAYIRQAAVIADNVTRTALDLVQVGTRQCDVVAAISAGLIAGTPEYGGYYPEGVLLNSGSDIPAQHGLWTDRPFEAGELTNIEIGGIRHAYNAGVTRSVVLGQPSPTLAKQHAVMTEGIENVLQAVRPGVTGDELTTIYHKTVEPHGYESRPSIGYSIGIGFPGLNWSEGVANLDPGDTNVLEANMVYHLIPQMWLEIEGWGMLLSETFRVTESGSPEVFTRLDRELVVKA